MGRIVYVNGKYVDESEALVSVFDRGFVMADAVYEVTTVIGGKLIDYPGHAARLKRSLSELGLAAPAADEDLLAIHRELVARNGIDNGLVYLQVTRGNPGDRDFIFPDPDKVSPTLVMYTQSKPAPEEIPSGRDGWKVISVPDLRWGRRDIKTVQLLYPSMAKMMAKAAGVDDAWLVEDGKVTEGTSNNVHIVKDGTIVTRELSNDILHGITRAAVLRLAREAQMKVEERAFTVDEAKAADEAFSTSAGAFVTPVIEIDGVAVGSGKPGPVARRLREIYLEESRKTAL
jgi:D-alanine transaminase